MELQDGVRYPKALSCRPASFFDISNNQSLKFHFTPLGQYKFNYIDNRMDLSLDGSRWGEIGIQI